jgi:hypothetical protein
MQFILVSDWLISKKSGAIQGPFHQTLIQTGPVVSEVLIKM